MANPSSRRPDSDARRRWWLAGLLLVGVALFGLWRTVRGGPMDPRSTPAVPDVTAVARRGPAGGAAGTVAPTSPPEAAVPILPVIDRSMKARLRAIHAVGLARGMRPDVLAKIGDSITVDGSFLAEFGCSDGDLGPYSSLAPTIAFFRSTELPPTANYARCGEQNSWTRVGPAAGNGWSAGHVLRQFPTADPLAILTATLRAESGLSAGDPVGETLAGIGAATSDVGTATPTIEVTGAVTATGTITATSAMTATLRPPPPTPTPPPECQAPDDTPLRCEIKAIQPGVAIVMFGTNDLEVGFTPAAFAANLDSIVSELATAGVIPVLSTIPPRTDREAANARVSDYNMAAIGVAKTRGVPLVNFWRALGSPDLVDRGMERDGIHPNDVDFGASFTEQGLRFGQNQRNLTAVQTLDKIRRIVYDDGPPEG